MPSTGFCAAGISTKISFPMDLKKFARSSHSRFSLPQTIPPGGPAHGRRRGRGVRGRGTDTGDCTWTAGGLRTHGRWIWLRAGARICTPPPGPRRRLTPRVHLTPRPSKPPGTRSGSTGWCGPLCKGHAQDGQVRRKDVAARPVDVVLGATVAHVAFRAEVDASDGSASDADADR